MVSKNYKMTAHNLIETGIAKKTALTKAKTASYTSNRKKASKRHSSVYESLDESLKEVKLIKEGKLKPKAWRELLEEVRNEKE